ANRLRASCRRIRTSLQAKSVRCSAAPITSNARLTRRARPSSLASRWPIPSSCGARDTTMIDFELSEEHRILEQTVRDWGAREVAPRIRELDRAHKFDRNILPQMASLGLLGASVPEQYGGAGMDYISLGLVSEELEYVDTSLRVIMSVH